MGLCPAEILDKSGVCSTGVKLPEIQTRPKHTGMSYRSKLARQDQRPDSQQSTKSDPPLRGIIEDQNKYISKIAMGFYNSIQIFYSQEEKGLSKSEWDIGSKIRVNARTIFAYSIIIRRVLDATELKLGRFPRIVS
jgi:hypothetical protein